MQSFAKKIGVLVTLALGHLPWQVAAQQASNSPAKSGWQTSGDLTLVSDYLYRGVSQTNEGVAAQGTLLVQHDSGWYGSLWTSNIGFGDGSLELDLSVGRKLALATVAESPLLLDLGLMQYRYPQGDNSSNGFNFVEAYSKLSWQSWTLGLALTDNYFGAGVGKFMYLTLDWQLMLTQDWSLALHLGHNQFAGRADLQNFLGSQQGGQHYLDHSLLLQTSMYGFTVAAGVAGTDISKQACAQLCDNRLLLRVSRFF